MLCESEVGTACPFAPLAGRRRRQADEGRIHNYINAITDNQKTGAPKGDRLSSQM